ncbi:MAG TPA: exopolysaccharide transport family protein [Pseudolabrys sp.]|nr:exopolysaccharide transport family protein [Pseudolabrys sp.]
MVFRKKASKAAKSSPEQISAPVRAPFRADGELDMRSLGRILWQKKIKIAGFTLIVAALTAVVVNALTPRFRSEARILLDARENVFLRAEADKNGDRSALDAEAVTSQLQLVLSRDLAREVIKKQNLTKIPEFDSALRGISPIKVVLGLFGIGRDPTSMTPEERTLESFYDRLNAYAVEKSRVIAIDFSSANPDLAARVANSIAEVYLNMQQTAKQEQTRAASQWLAGEIATMRKKAADAENKVEQYRAKVNLFSGSNNSSLSSQQLTEVNSQIAAARGQKADLEARAQQLRDLLHSGHSIESSEIANSDAVRRLIEQRVALRAQLAEQSSTLLDKHPRIKELKAQIAELDREIRAEGERMARQLDYDAKVAGARVQTLTASLDQVKKLASQTNEQDLQLRALEREAKTDRDLLESYLAKYREAAARENINAAPPEARIISRASPAIKPDFPKKVPMVLIAAFAAFGLSTGLIVIGALLAPMDETSYPAAYGLPTVSSAAMPLMPGIQPPWPPSPRSRTAGTVPLRTSEQIVQRLLQTSEAGRRVAVAGTGRNVGTTYTAVALARILARESSVMLVDLNFGAPNLSVLSTNSQAPGMAELLRGQATFGEIITRDQLSNVHLVAAGKVGVDGTTLAASSSLPGLIEALARSYDYVVLDIGAVPEIPVEPLALLAPRAVLVATDPASAAARSARERLDGAGFVDVSMVLGGAPAAAAA